MQNQNQNQFITYFKILQEQPNLSYTQDQSVKLMQYLEFLSDCYMWKHLNKYLKLFTSFTNFSISGDEFTDQFLRLRALHVNECNRLIQELKTSLEQIAAFPIDSRAFGFEAILSQTFEDCDAFVSDELLENIQDSRAIGEIDEIDENQLHARIEKVISMIQK